MGIFDIAYAELQWIRDKKLSAEKRKTAAREAIKKILNKFILDWKTLSAAAPPNLHEHGNSMLKDYSSAFVDIASEVSDLIEERRIIDELIKIAADMRKSAYFPWRIGGGNEYMKEVDFISKKCSQLLHRF